MLYKVLKQHVPSQSGICWSHLKQVNGGEKAASEGHGIAKVNVTELQNQDGGGEEHSQEGHTNGGECGGAGV